MTERQSGLRFDIYERIHLAEDTAAVKELNEVELVPHIQVYTEEEQALLKGHLYLTGSYQGETGDGARTLEHLIPVEITLPLNRIQDVSQVSVDIDNFDVDVLNSRSLNVTGVLTLHGIEMLSVSEDTWREEEETVFVHEAPAYSNVSGTAEASLSAKPAQPKQQEESSSPWAPYKVSIETWRSEQANEEPAPTPAVNAGASEIYLDADDENENAPWPAEAQPNQAPVGEEDLEQPAAEDSSQAEAQAADETPAAPQEEKKELKIAFGSKPPSSESAYHLQSLIHTQEYRAEASPEEQEQEPTPRTDALEWKRLFSQSQDEEQRFSKVRVCIVQKEDTLDSIAERYNLNPKEIQLYNRLTEEDVSEGKALFIPR